MWVLKLCLNTCSITRVYCTAFQKLSLCPTYSLQQGAMALVSTDNQGEQETWDDDPTPVQYHVFPLPHSSIFVVDTEQGFEQFLDYIKVSARIILLRHIFCVRNSNYFVKLLVNVI
jgi:hypothetical protein